jgi:hypothetical protein
VRRAAPYCLTLAIGILIGATIWRPQAAPQGTFTPVKMLYWVWQESVRKEW